MNTDANTGNVEPPVKSQAVPEKPSPPKRFELILDPVDAETFDNEMAERRRRADLMPEYDGNFEGACVAEMIRDLNEYRQLADARAAGRKRHRRSVGLGAFSRYVQPMQFELGKTLEANPIRKHRFHLEIDAEGQIHLHVNTQISPKALGELLVSSSTSIEESLKAVLKKAAAAETSNSAGNAAE